MSYFQQTPAEDNALNALPLLTPVLEQHDIPLDPLAQFYIVAQPLFRFLRGCALIGYPTFSLETGQHHNSFSLHTDSWFRIPTQDLLQFLKHDAFTDSEEPSFAGGNGTPYPASWLVPATVLYRFLQCYAHPASGLPSFGDGHENPAGENDMPVDAPLLFIPVESLFEFLQPYAISPVPYSFDKWRETPAVQQLEDGSESDLTSRSVTPTQSDSEGQVDAQTDEATASILDELECPVCRAALCRVQERNRHVESHLPHSIHCPFQGCPWTGRRHCDFKGHWSLKHQEAGEAPGKDATEIYDPKNFVKSILDGTPVEEVVQSAFAKVQESLGRLGKPDVMVNVCGRNRDLKNGFVSFHPNPTSTAFNYDL